MKISHIELTNYHQFQNFKLDLTYPQGHVKAGEPLDKICFIGQSGTGKTTLLDAVQHIVYHISKKSTKEVVLGKQIRFTEENMKYGFKIGQTPYESKDNHIIQRLKNKQSDQVFIFAQEESAKTQILNTYWQQTQLVLLTFFLNANLQLSDTKICPISQQKQALKNTDNVETMWQKMQEEVKTHTNQKSTFRFAISKAAEAGDTAKMQEQVQALKKWESENPNPLTDLAINFLDPILAQFGLKTKTDLDSLEEAAFIHFLDKNGQVVPQYIWSTGTQQIVFKVVPLYLLKPKNGIILIDEPENSLYPDIQTKIVEHYTRLAPDCQFFFATHSPIVASSFEPWEIVELKFDEQGKVYRELYYEGENHINNYFIDPRYYKYGTVLREIFDLKQEGGDSSFRNKAQMHASYLKDRVKKLNQEGNTTEAKKLYREYKNLAKKLAWELTD